jgi:NitT/TauT family transport system permease protein
MNIMSLFRKASGRLLHSRNIYAVIFRKLIFYVLIIAVWQTLFAFGIWPQYIFPGPLQVYNSLKETFADGLFVKAMSATMSRIAVGYSISLLCGVVLGLVMGRIRIIDETLGSLVLGIQALPSICWLPLALIWFGLNDRAIIFVVVMGALFSITIGVETGVKNTPPQLIRAAKTLGSKGFSLYWRVIIPAAMPSILAGLKQGWSFAWRSLMAGELLFYSLSLGNLLQTGRDLNDTSLVIAVMFIIMITGAAVDRLIFNPLLQRTRRKWGLNVQ